MAIINVGVGDVYVTKVLANMTVLPSDNIIESEANKIPNTSGGITFNYSISKKKIENDKGVTVDEAVESESLSIKVGILEDMVSMYAWLSERAVIDSTGDAEDVIGIGGSDASTSDKFIIRYVHTRKNGKKVRYTAIVLPSSGFSEPYTKGEAKIVDAEMTGVEHELLDGHLLVKRVEKETTQATAETIDLVVVPENGTVLGKAASDLQSNISISATEITGTLKYVTGYTGFSGVADKQSGNYIALHITPVDGATTTVEVIDGDSGKVTMDSDNICVLKIASTTQKIQFISTKNNNSITKTYSLTGLTLETA